MFVLCAIIVLRNIEISISLGGFHGHYFQVAHFLLQQNSYGSHNINVWINDQHACKYFPTGTHEIVL